VIGESAGYSSHVVENGDEMQISSESKLQLELELGVSARGGGCEDAKMRILGCEVSWIAKRES
jgi:hypothetical protein